MGHYRIIRRLATGGMAEVFLGKVVGAGGFEKPVAIKRMLPGVAADPNSAAAFLQEARLCVHLVHPNVVQVLDLGTSGGAPYLVMELVDGEDLRKILNAAAAAGAPIQPAEAVHITACVAEALAYADEAPGPGGEPLHVVHRDVNPSNVMISVSGEVKLADFGVAKAADGRQSTQGNLLKGKLGYLAPELLTGAEARHASDIFLTGVLLYELLAGKPLFAAGGAPGRTLAAIAQHDENRLELPPGIPDAIGPMLRRALAKEPSARYAHAGELAHDLRAVLHGQGWRCDRSTLAARMASLFPGRPKLDRDLGPGVVLRDDRTVAPAVPAPEAAPAGNAPRAPSAKAEEISFKPLSRQRIGEMMVEAGLITEAQLQTLLARQRQEGGRLGEWAVSLDFAPARSVLQLLAKQLAVPFVTDEKLLEANPSAEVLARYPQELALRLLALPVSERNSVVYVAMTDPGNLERLDLIRFRLGGKVQPIVCTEFGLRRAIARVYGGRAEELKWRQLDAADPLSFLSTRMIDFDAPGRQGDATTAWRPQAFLGTPPPIGLGQVPGVPTPPGFPVPGGTPGTNAALPPGYLLAYVPTGIGPDGQPIYVAVPVPQPVGAPGAPASPGLPAMVPGVTPAPTAGIPAAEPRNELRSTRLEASREIEFEDDDLGEELELDDGPRR